jgi:TonB-linked SusC/RagA family outer membrane protein
MQNKVLHQLIFMSKLTIFGVLMQCLFITLLFASDGKSQSIRPVSDVYCNLGFENKTLSEVFKSIEKETNFKFSFYDDLNLNHRITIAKKRQALSDLLLKISELSSLSFKQVNNVITVRPTPHNQPREEEIEIIIQTRRITGKITSETGETLPGVNVIEKGTTNGTITDFDGDFALEVAENAVLVFSSVGYMSAEVEVGNRSVINFQMTHDIRQLQEIVVVGYGVQKRSDITGTVASLGQERLEMVPNLNIAQAIQGAIPGVMIQTTSAGAAPSEVIMVRGRNSIRASNDPLFVVDGIPYGGSISDLNPNDIQSIEVLKDASAAAIYGSRGSNGVILITTKTGVSDRPVINYNGYYSIQDFVKLPDVMDGGQFYEFKKHRWPNAMTLSEEAVFQAGPDEWVDWLGMGLRKGRSHQHNLSASGALGNTQYYIAGGLMDVKGLIVNDNYQRLTSRINVDTKIGDAITLGTRSQFSYDDRSGLGPSMSGLFWMNPLTKSLDADGNYLIYPWAEDPFFEHPLAPTLYHNINDSYQILTNNYAIVDIPFIEGLSYRINTGILFRFRDNATYRARNTKAGFEAGGTADVQRRRNNNAVVENILSYNRQIGVHNLFFTGVYSYENNKFSSNSLTARGFPHDFLLWYAADQAELSVPSFAFDETTLISQMLRFNYAYDSRYLFTLTGRRDGYSGFGSATKWGVFPSIALGWNIANEDFFPAKDLINELKLRASWGLNGNQAVGAYESISRLSGHNMVYDEVPYAGYIPSVLGQDRLGWESSRTLNFGIDVGILNDRFHGDFNFYKTNTTDLLLNRSISSVHGITQITQNIGETENFGFEMSLTSRNIVSGNFNWNTTGNMAFVRNRIVSLYGILGEDGREIDDVGNAWFIGKPIRVNYWWAWDGVWQQEEADQATRYGSQPGFVKLRDLNDDGQLTGDDRVIIGQQDPKVLWGMTNSFSFNNFKLDVFMHGVHGVTRHNTLMTDDDTFSQARRRTINKNYWTPDNPTNDWVANVIDAERMGGIIGRYYENASFIRIKDISLSYDFPLAMIDRLKMNRLRLYVTGRNLLTFTKWSGLDPELSSQVATPLQNEFVFGINLGL